MIAKQLTLSSLLALSLSCVNRPTAPAASPRTIEAESGALSANGSNTSNNDTSDEGEDEGEDEDEDEDEGEDEDGDTDSSPSAHIIYLHGRIVAEQGPQAVSEEYGPYLLGEIVQALEREGAIVEAPLRTSSQETEEVVDEVAARIQQLLTEGLPPERLLLIGASQGAMIAMLVSQKLEDPKLSFVFLSSCNPWIRDHLSPRLSGRVLSIYEAGDPFGGSCDQIVAASPGVTEFSEVRLTTGLRHGFLYRPLPQWVTPTLSWISGEGR